MARECKDLPSPQEPTVWSGIYLPALMGITNGEEEPCLLSLRIGIGGGPLSRKGSTRRIAIAQLTKAMQARVRIGIWIRISL